MSREIREEVGGDIKSYKFCQNYPVSICAGITDESNMLAVVELSDTHENQLDEGELIEVVQILPVDLAQALKYNKINITATGLLGATILLNKLGINLSYIYD